MRSARPGGRRPHAQPPASQPAADAVRHGAEQQVPLDDFIAYLKRLEDSDDIDLLVFHSTGKTPEPEDQVLLDPTRVDAYASALLVAAKDEPDGPGHLLESRVSEGDFKLVESERLGNKAFEKHVL